MQEFHAPEPSAVSKTLYQLLVSCVLLRDFNCVNTKRMPGQSLASLPETDHWVKVHVQAVTASKPITEEQIGCYQGGYWPRCHRSISCPLESAGEAWANTHRCRHYTGRMQQESFSQRIVVLPSQQHEVQQGFTMCGKRASMECEQRLELMWLRWSAQVSSDWRTGELTATSPPVGP